jgi:prepilin-type N-terminal cleavage/methylation domain-containing protein
MKSDRRNNRAAGGRARNAFSLVELVMVVTIIGIVAAIAVPRMNGVTRRASETALAATLESVRGAIDRYYAEHDSYPGYHPTTRAADGAYFVRQLLEYSDNKGNTQATPGFPYIYGPYLRAPFPRNPFNNLQTVHVKGTPADANPADGSVGWVAVLSHGYFGISAPTADLDSIGVKVADRPKFTPY